MSRHRTRRRLVAALTLSLTTLSGTSAARANELPPDLAVVTRTGDVLFLRGGVVTPAAHDGIVALDGRTFVSAEHRATQTVVTWTDMASRQITGALTVDGRLRVAATDLSGTFVALTGQGGDGSATELVVASPKGEVMRRTYEGSLMPEALSSTDPATQVPFQMFVLRYVDGGATWASTATSPARRRYEVRAIDLASGSLTNPLQLRTKLTVAQEMNAEPLGAVTSTAMSMVFSLYRGTEDGDSELAFVHALHPDQGVWCLDLPAELELLTRPGSLGLADGGRTLLAASSNGLISETNIEALLDPQRSPGPTRTVRAWSPTDATATPHLASAGDSLAVAQGRQVAWLARGTLGVESRVTLDRPARAVAMTTPRSLVVADDTGLSIVDPGGAWHLDLWTDLDIARIIPLGVPGA